MSAALIAVAPLWCRIGTVQGGSAVAALLLLCGCVVAIVHAASPDRRVLALTAGMGAVFQTLHGTEHVVQLAGLAFVGDEITLTWWAAQIAGGYAELLSTSAKVGTELLHWTGDGIYLAGVAAWWRLRRTPLAGLALAVQATHQLEHTLLVTTGLTLGEPFGMTMLGGPGSRIVAHFLLNLGGSVAWAADAGVWRVHVDRAGAVPSW